MPAGTTIAPPYLFSECPACLLPIRFTVETLPDGQVRYSKQAFSAGIRIHLLYGCEAARR
jgi:hypothetical protein